MHALFLNNFPLPDGSANAIRVNELIKIYSNLGYDITNIGIDYHSEKNDFGNYYGQSYKNIGVKTNFNIKIIEKIARKKATRKKLREEILAIDQHKKINVIIISGFVWDYHNTLIELSNSLSFKVIVNMVEWHSISSFPGIFGFYKYILNQIGIKFIIPKMKNIICISSLLEEYYINKGCNTVLIPSILDCNDYDKEVTLKQNNTYNFGYAGNPGKKDNIPNFIKAMALLSQEELNKIQLNLYGITENEIENLGVNVKILDTLKKHITFHGKIAFNQVKIELTKLDFTILFRPNKLSSHAGFPTKVPESLAAGVPILLNITSDLGRYIIDNESGIICKDDSVESCLAGIRKVLELSTDEINIMKNKSKACAKEFFNYTQYVNKMNIFLDKIK